MIRHILNGRSLAEQQDQATAAAGSPLLEYYQALLGRLGAPGDGAPVPRTVGLTSCERGEGVTTVAANLAKAGALCSSDGRVLLVDANLPQPALQQVFAVQRSPGLSDVLQGRIAVEQALRESPLPQLDVLAAGAAVSCLTAPELDACRRLFDQLKARYDWILVDLPAARQAALCLPLAAQLDGVLLVVEAERVPWQAALRTTEVLAQCQAQVLGVVLNKRRHHLPEWLYHRL